MVAGVQINGLVQYELKRITRIPPYSHLLMYPSSEPNIVRSLVKFTFRGIFLRSINVPLMQSVPMFMFVNKIVKKKVRKRKIVIIILRIFLKLRTFLYQPFIACTNYNKEKRKTDVEKNTKLEQNEKRKNVIQTNIRSVGGVADVEVNGEAVSEEGVDVVSPPDDLTGVPVADRLAVSQ